jgi:hypothetical protein
MLVLTLKQNVGAQGFVNLNFESSEIVTSNYSSFLGSYYGTANVPVWTGYSSPGSSGANLFTYNDPTLGTPSAALVGTYALDGTWSMLLQAFSLGGASISQTGLVPSNAESLLSVAQQVAYSTGTLQVSLGDQNLTFYSLLNEANCTLYGANISTYAGQTEELTFSALQDLSGPCVWEIDDIQFASSSVPEPSLFSLLISSMIVLCHQLTRPNLLARVGAGRKPEFIEMMQVGVSFNSGSARLAGR